MPNDAGSIRPTEAVRGGLIGLRADVGPGALGWMSTRAGGVSRPPFDSFNLGDHVQDDAAAVAHNRALLAQCSGVEPGFLQQVHGAQVVDAGQVQGCAPQADACFTQQPGIERMQRAQ